MIYNATSGIDQISEGIKAIRKMKIHIHPNAALELMRYKPYSRDRKPIFVDDYYGLVDCVCCGKRKHKSKFKYLDVGYRRNECNTCRINFKSDHRADAMAYCFASMDVFKFKNPMVVVDFGAVN